MTIDIKGPSQLQDLSDVNVSGLSSNDLIQYDGTNFVNTTIPSALDGTYLRLDTSNDPLTGELVTQDIQLPDAGLGLVSHLLEFNTGKGVTDAIVQFFAQEAAGEQRLDITSPNTQTKDFRINVNHGSGSQDAYLETDFLYPRDRLILASDASLFMLGNGDNIEIQADNANDGVVDIQSLTQFNITDSVNGGNSIEIMVTKDPAVPTRGAVLEVDGSFAPTGGGALAYGYEGITRKSASQSFTALIGISSQLVWDASVTGNTTVPSTFFVTQPSLGAGATAPTTITGLTVQNHGISGITNARGIRIDNQTGSTNNYSIDSRGGMMLHSGDVHIGGTSNPTDTLQVTGDINLSGELKGSRLALAFGYNPASSADRFMRGTNGVDFSATKGWTMPRNGSITAVSCDLLVATQTNLGTIDVEVRVNNTTVYTLTLTSAGAGVDIKGQQTQARGTDTFVAGDRIQVFLNHNTFVGSTDNVLGIVEFAFDT